ncbi:lipopolysaccharide transport periplasmic protein LptA [Verrucomicrobiota bacterium]
MKQKGICSMVGNRAGACGLLAAKCFSMVLVLLLWVGDLAAADDKPSVVPVNEDTNCTVITSRRLSYDSQGRIAVFEGDVVVIDPEMNIEADRLTVVFAEDNKVSTIEAVGNVVIKQEDKTGFGKKAFYYVKEGKIVLTGNPRVQRKSDELKGTTITFFRDSGRMVCEPNAVLKLYSTPEVKDGGVTKE